MGKTGGPKGGCIQKQVTETERMVMWQTGGITSRGSSQELTPAEYMKETPEARRRAMTIVPGSKQKISSAHPGIVGRRDQLASALFRINGNDGSSRFL